MAFWGAPTLLEEHAKHTCFAAIDQRKALWVRRNV